MHRRALNQELQFYRCLEVGQDAVLGRLKHFVASEATCFDRQLTMGHITGSAWIVDPLRRQTVLLYHTKLKRWLQPGGHCDGNPHTWEVAHREASEETGIAMDDLILMRTATDRQRPHGERCRIFDVDIHQIPSRGSEPTHDHYDVRFMFMARSMALAPPAGESQQVKWIDLDKVADLTNEDSVLRMVRKTANA